MTMTGLLKRGKVSGDCDVPGGAEYLSLPVWFDLTTALPFPFGAFRANLVRRSVLRGPEWELVGWPLRCLLLASGLRLA